ncbi:hypothetical protein RHSIM_Rhsim03G0021900 [Rhododendron simsii]|uniref:Uncharacterized protein n=1 Tax=Rhododendron simsii TaxID=118357 RepID=A0A834HGL2_RHOSS|nr:hypothetical protein RHSIM_Rhsim03G0021900 [Rhododendron simsii]
MAKAIFSRSTANVKTWVSDKTAKDLNSSAPVEFSFLANAKGNLQLLGEDERRGSESGSRNGGVCDNVGIGIRRSVGVNDLLPGGDSEVCGAPEAILNKKLIPVYRGSRS